MKARFSRSKSYRPLAARAVVDFAKLTEFGGARPDERQRCRFPASWVGDHRCPRATVWRTVPAVRPAGGGRRDPRGCRARPDVLRAGAVEPPFPRARGAAGIGRTR